MSLSESERNIIVNRELEKSQRTFEDVLFCAREGKWETAANRLYYFYFMPCPRFSFMTAIR